MKQTFYHRGGLKPGTYFLIGEHNKVKNGNLMFDRIIGDFLVAKGLATTEDHCIYTLECCDNEFILEYDNETGELCLTIGEEQSCVTISNSGGAIEVNNALTGTGEAGNPVQWGGNLVKNTTINGLSNYRVEFIDPTTFFVQTDGATAKGMLRVSGLVSQPSMLRHIKDTNNSVYATIDLDIDSTFGLMYNDSNGLIGFRIFPDEGDVENLLALRTKAVRNGTAVNGQIPILIDSSEGIFEWGNVSGGSVSFDDYEDDTAAGVGGIAIGQCYSVTAGNPYGLADGTIKKRRT